MQEISELNELTRDVFLRTMADRYIERTELEVNDAFMFAELCLDAFLEDEGIEFGENGYDWTRPAARDLADDDMENWDD